MKAVCKVGLKSAGYAARRGSGHGQALATPQPGSTRNPTDACDARAVGQKEQVMANPNEINPNIDDAESDQSGPRVPDDKVYRLTRRLSEAKGSGVSGGGGARGRIESRASRSQARGETIG